MPFELKLAWKYSRARRKSLARFTSVVAVMGIAAGVASLIIAQALANGFADEMKDKILANTAHVSVFSDTGAKIEYWQEIKTGIERLDNVSEVSATSYENAFVIGSDSINHALLKVHYSESYVQSSGKTEISIGEKLAEKAKLAIGDEAEIVILENQIEPRRVKVLVAEIFRTGLYEYDSTWIRISPEDFAALYGEKFFAPKVLNISVENIYKARETANEIKEKLGDDFKILDWQEANQPLFAALSLERKVSLVVISLIIFIAALNITTTLALLVNERKLDIAVLRTCGAKTRKIVSIFLLEGLFLGFFGIALGVIFGLFGCFAGNYFKLIRLSEEVYSLSSIPFHADFGEVMLIVLVALFLCLAACVFPAFKASKIKPLENLRTQ